MLIPCLASATLSLLFLLPIAPQVGITAQAAESEGTPMLDDALRDLPLGELHIEGRTAIIPDWRVVAFSDFPPLMTDGEWGEVNWKAGDAIASVLTLGDVQADLQLHLLTTEAIGEKLGIQPNEIGELSLDEFQLLKRQTLRSLVQAVPSLLNEPIEDVSPLQDLILGVNPALVTNRLSVGDVLEQWPDAGEFSLGYLDLTQYTLADLPGVEAVPLQSFALWQEATIREIPLLEFVSWWSFPKTPELDGAIAITSITTEAGEAAVHADEGADFVIQLDSFEDDRIPLVWQLGATQSGGIGEGDLSQINDGEELSGALPFGGGFQVVPYRVTPSTFETAIYFRTCRSSQEVLECSPYGIGPIPFIVYGAGSNIFLGQVTFQALDTAPDVVIELEEDPDLEAETLLNTLLPTTTAKVAAGGSVALILTLTAAVIVWAVRGDPIKFTSETSRWLWEKWQRHCPPKDRKKGG